MIVRSATEADVPGILPMVRAICAMHGAMDPVRYDFLPGVVQRYERWLPARASDPRSVLLVVEEDGALLGFLVGSVEGNIPVYRMREFGYIHDVWVEERARGKGAGRALVDAAMARFAAMGVSQVRLETARGNDGARRLFEACGFRVGAVEMMREVNGNIC